MKNKGTLLGVIGVDAGICWIGDPCYILHKDATERKELQKSIGKDWGEFCTRLFDGRAKGEYQFNYPLGHAGLGVCVPTGHGDGCYPVYGEFEGGALARVTIDFMGDDEDDED